MNVLKKRKKVYIIYILIMILCYVYSHASVQDLFDVMLNTLILSIFSYCVVISDYFMIVKDWKSIFMKITHGLVKYLPFILTFGFACMAIENTVEFIKTRYFVYTIFYLPAIESFFASLIMYKRFEESI